jgi:hypothetical protein
VQSRAPIVTTCGAKRPAFPEAKQHKHWHESCCLIDKTPDEVNMIGAIRFVVIGALIATITTHSRGVAAPEAEPLAEGTPAAQTGGAAALLDKVKRALLPWKSGVREVEIVTRDPHGKERVWHGREARRATAGKSAVVLVLDAPESVKGFSILAVEGADSTHQMWAYTPPLERVRALEYVGMAQSFLGTDLTYADLGLFDFGDGESRLAGEDTIDGRRVEVVETTPSNRRAYSRVLTYVTADGWPVRREYRDVAGRPWRVLEYDSTKAADGSWVLRGLRARDTQTGYETELRYLDFRAADVPQELFDPSALGRVAEEQRLASLSAARDAPEEADAAATTRGGADEPASAGP